MLVLTFNYIQIYQIKYVLFFICIIHFDTKYIIFMILLDIKHN